ncbi:MAG: PAS domain S-box protein [Anaerolineae bacterium]|nr:PAS domain S-box protein [Anaerolineae bacterium]
MSWLVPTTATTLLIATVIAWFHAVYVWRNRTGQPASGFIWTMVITGVWTLTSAIVALSGPSPKAYFWMKIGAALIAYLAVGILVTCAQYTGHTRLTRRRTVALLLIVPVMTTVVSLTSDQHQLYLYDLVFHTSGAEITTFNVELGPWFIIHAAYSYSLVIIGILMLLQYIAAVRFSAYRSQAALLLIGLILPIIAATINTFLLPEHTFLPQMVAIISAPVIFWALFRYRLFSLQPIAREQAFEDMDDAIIVIDAEKRLVDVNPSAERFLAQNVQELIGKPIQSVFRNGLSQFDLGHDVGQTHTQIEIGTGSQRRTYDVRITSLNRDRAFIGQLIVIRDSTEQQRAEAEAHRREIERERVRTLSEFVSNASHEFRTPLSIIKTSAYLINRDGALDGQSKRLEQIDDQVDRISALVDDLLAVVRLEQRSTLELSLTDVNAVLHGVVTRINREVTAKDLCFNFELTDPIAPVLGDAGYLADALYEIADNAVRYTPEGGCVTISTTQDGDCVTITIADTGIGIDAEHLPRIFDVFYRADAAHTISGFGVGLAIAKRIVHLHGGTIYATSTVGQGTIVHVSLPTPQ